MSIVMKRIFKELSSTFKDHSETIRQRDLQLLESLQYDVCITCMCKGILKDIGLTGF